MQPLIYARDVMELRTAHAGEAALWVVDVRRQILRGWTRGREVGPFPVSTALAGLGNRPGSLRTPLGPLRVHAVLGVGQPAGQPFVERVPVGEPCRVWRGGTGDRILSRVLTLAGLVPGLNDHSLDRCIYLHGTDQEEKLGRAASHGCIRLANKDIITLADPLEEIRPLVWVGAVGGSPKAPIRALPS